VASATAIAPTAAEADALSTAFFVLGLEGTREYCLRHPEVTAVLITKSARAVKFGPDAVEVLI
jgi:thiamine biosynthesis lipoprotein